ncbi:uroporphyrinogen-III synthase [Sulfurospirillum arcachonense]|uniref:uroporphyrinogen-III synthase n=1 Tax=Sulfurospirillum arcachonense TaxID=57666 RepID=UPI000468B5A5|nr:uroporphyrinogen-III synthase [Sulfurospirillum arcachonense]
MNIYLLSDTYHEGVINLPQIKITCKAINLDLTSYDALIFSSKNAVKALCETNSDWKKIPSYAIGNPTANYIKENGGFVEYISKSAYGNDFAKEIIKNLKGKKVLFLRAKKVLSDLENILKKAQIDIASQIVYETTCNDENKFLTLEKKSIFIFTSPSTVECFFKHYKWDKSYKAVCIGKVTAKALPLTITPYISETQTIQSCITLSKTLIKQS